MSLVLLVAFGCGDSGPKSLPGDELDAAQGAADARLGPTTTNVHGVMDGTQFQLIYPVVLWDSPFDGLCLSDVPIEPPDCGGNDPRRKYVFFGKFEYAGEDSRWAFPEVEQSRFGSTGTHEVLQIAFGGTLEVFEYDPAGERLSLTFSVEFNHGITSGTVAVP